MADDGDLQSLTVLGPGASAFHPQVQAHDCIHIFHYQTAQANPAILEAYCYSDKVSYRPGEVVSVHASSTAGTADFQIYRDGVTPQAMSEFNGVALRSVGVAPDFYERVLAVGPSLSNGRFRPMHAPGSTSFA